MSNPESPSARSARQSASLQSIINLALVAIIVVLINWIGFKYYEHIDLSQSQYYTLSAKTKEELAKLDSPLHIYTLLNPQATVQDQQIENLIKEYVAAQPKYVSYEKIDTDIDPKRAKELYDKLHFSATDYLVILEYKESDGRTPRFVKQDDFFDMNPMTGQIGAFKGEQQLTGALTALIEGKPYKVYFTEGHGEHSIHDSSAGTSGYGQAASLLKDDNVETTTFNLAVKGEVPEDADAVVIAGPTLPFAPVEIEAINKYVENNGKLMVLLDPYYTSGLESLLAKYGLKYEDDLILRQVSGPTGSTVAMPYAFIYQGGFSPQPITTKMAQAGLQLLIQDARSITIPMTPGPDANKTQFLLQTDTDSWGSISRTGALPDPRTLTYNKVTDIGGPLTVAAQYDGGPTTDPKTKASMFATRIVAVGASKFIDNTTIEQVGANFFTNAIDWLVKKDAVLDIAPKKPTEYGVTLNTISYNTLAWTALGVFPGTALIIGFMVWFSRRK